MARKREFGNDRLPTIADISTGWHPGRHKERRAQKQWRTKIRCCPAIGESGTMPRTLLPTLLLGSSLVLGGCAAGLAAGALGAAVRSAQGQPQSNDHLKPLATQACSARASQHGAVHVIDVEQRTSSKIIVWGTAAQGADRRSFECAYTTQIVSFKLRTIRP